MKRSSIGRRLLLAGLLAGVAPASPMAQEDREARPAPQALSPGVEVRIRGQENGTSPAAEVDESALRYFAARGDRARVEEEIERLRARHPGWEPPADLYGPVTTVDERPLWELYQSGDYGAVRERIAVLRREHPDWSPPARLIALMEENEVRARFVRLEEDAAWRRLVDVAEAFPSQVTCAAIDNMWRVARAHAELGDRDAAMEVYARIIEDCASVDHRIATLQKARERVGRERLSELFAREDARDKPAADAARVAAAKEQLTATAGPPPVIRALFANDAGLAEARRAERAVIRARHADGAEQLGWINRDAGNHGEALAWFRRSHEWEKDASAAEGVVLSLAALGRYEEVEPWTRRYPRALGVYAQDLRQQRVLAAFEAGAYATVLDLTRSARSAGDRTMRGWTFLQLERPTEASIAFEEVVYDDAVRPSERREAAFGLARAALALDNLSDAEAIVTTYRLQEEQRHEIHAEILARRANRAFGAQDFRTAVALLEARRSYAPLDRNMLIQEAWGRYHIGQKGRAARIFRNLHRVYATEETEEGMRVTARAINGF